MASAAVYQGVQNNMPNTKGLFAGTKFWFSSTVPQKGRFIEDVKANGGEVVLLEKQADICLYDHARKNPPPGMYSYRYVEHSIKNGQLEDLEAHRIGTFDSRAARPVGSVTLASKGSRASFTEADDQMLWDWVKPFAGMRGSAGNALYQELERANPRHTYQSWRDRWLKYVQFQNRTLTPQAGQQQQHRARTRSQLGTSTRAASQTVVGVARAAASPRVVVEVPLKGSPRRKRGRPPKIPQPKIPQVTLVDTPTVVPGEDTLRKRPGRPRRTLLTSSDNSTIEVAAHTVPKQRQRSTSLACEQNAENPRLEKTLTSKSNNNVQSRKFSDERESLLTPAGAMLDAPEHGSNEQRERMANCYPAQMAQQRKSYIDEVFIPLCRDQGKKSLKQDATLIVIDAEPGSPSGGTESEAQSSQSRLEENQMAEPQSEVGQRGVDEERNAVWENGQQFHRERFSPVSNTSYHGHQPIPYESRKRSFARCNLQEDDGSLYSEVAASSARASSQITGTKHRRDGDVRELAVTQATKRRKLSVTRGTALEIQSTPERAQESDALEELQGTPTPRAPQRPHHDLQNHTFSRLLSAPSESRRDMANVLTSTEQDFDWSITVEPETHTSPISVHLLSDHDPAVTIGSSTPKETAEIGTSSSPTPEFEMAPEFPQVQEDVSVDGDQARFETAAESQAAVKASIPSTQQLFAAPIQGGEEPLDLGLPEPEGGWTAIEPDLAIANDDRHMTAAPDSPPSSTVSTQSLDLEAWVALRKGEGCDIHLLFTAARATNMHSKVADMVYESLERGKGVPHNVRGVWTNEDDEALMGADARSIQKLGEKHGQESVDERFECLDIWRGQ